MAQPYWPMDELCRRHPAHLRQLANGFPLQRKEQMRVALGAKILTNEPDKVAAGLGLPIGTPGIVRVVRVCRYPKPLGLLVALIAMAFATATLQAQILSPMQEHEFDTAARPASSVATYRLPATVGHAGHFGQTGQQEKSVQMVIALGVAYVVLGGLVFALAASFRLLSDKVDSFFAQLIPKPTGARGLKISVHSSLNKRSSQVRSRKPHA